jgi:hypothetical protein
MSGPQQMTAKLFYESCIGCNYFHRGSTVPHCEHPSLEFSEPVDDFAGLILVPHWCPKKQQYYYPGGKPSEGGV